MKHISYQLIPVPPYRLDLTAWALRREPVNLMDRWDGQTYQRVLTVVGKPVAVSVVPVGPPEAPLLQVTAIGEMPESILREISAKALAKLLGTNIDLTDFYRISEADSRLRSLVEPFRGFKPPRFPTLFETAVNGIACQQISLVLGIRLLNRFVENFGREFNGSTKQYAFPLPEDLASLTPDLFRSLGFSRNKAVAIIELSRAIVNGLDLERLEAVDDKEALDFLRQQRGIGQWTAEYILLRGLGRIDIFPGNDSGARRKMQSWLGLARPPDYEETKQTLDRWAPYEGMVYFHLLLRRLRELGYLKSVNP